MKEKFLLIVTNSKEEKVEEYLEMIVRFLAAIFVVLVVCQVGQNIELMSLKRPLNN